MASRSDSGNPVAAATGRSQPAAVPRRSEDACSRSDPRSDLGSAVWRRLRRLSRTPRGRQSRPTVHLCARATTFTRSTRGARRGGTATLRIECRPHTCRIIRRGRRASVPTAAHDGRDDTARCPRRRARAPAVHGARSAVPCGRAHTTPCRSACHDDPNTIDSSVMRHIHDDDLWKKGDVREL